MDKYLEIRQKPGKKRKTTKDRAVTKLYNEYCPVLVSRLGMKTIRVKKFNHSEFSEVEKAEYAKLMGYYADKRREKPQAKRRYLRLVSNSMNVNYHKNSSLKFCTGCKKMRGLSYFDNRGHKNSKRNICASCKAKKNKAYYLANKEKWKDINKGYVHVADRVPE